MSRGPPQHLPYELVEGVLRYLNLGSGAPDLLLRPLPSSRRDIVSTHDSLIRHEHPIKTRGRGRAMIPTIYMIGQAGVYLLVLSMYSNTAHVYVGPK